MRRETRGCHFFCALPAPHSQPRPAARQSRLLKIQSQALNFQSRRLKNQSRRLKNQSRRLKNLSRALENPSPSSTLPTHRPIAQCRAKSSPIPSVCKKNAGFQKISPCANAFNTKVFIPLPRLMSRTAREKKRTIGFIERFLLRQSAQGDSTHRTRNESIHPEKSK